MESIIIKGTDFTPNVILDPRNDLFEISGMSLPENVLVFYSPILDWIEKYAVNPVPETVFNFKLEYFNTPSSKRLLDILMKLEEIQKTGKKVLVKWHYEQFDKDMREAGKEYAELVELPFEHISYNCD